jgi:hypothetical protein
VRLITSQDVVSLLLVVAGIWLLFSFLWLMERL